MASEDVQTNLRLPGDLKDRLVASAAESNRSLSAEAASRLEDSFRNRAFADVVMDQAQQIRELRAKVMEGNFTMVVALKALEGKGDTAEAIGALAETIKKTEQESSDFFIKLMQERVAREGQQATIEMVQDVLQEARGKRKP
ncbi:TraY domain-containing protein [Acidovorax sp. LjRoot66]|uniref:TraY domain-containing protein n=1 Tax=Acidovorax sp. LjRoot66 TaxID=3342334 RepID=UPI003ECEA308